ncbi:hypothetical protein [Nocardiopsis dassonvillei]|uniref:hypothetical protein n=1 Tax=Nocardiopsis dassonvillei TaxID=2014 RepID=UPI003642AEA4
MTLFSVQEDHSFEERNSRTGVVGARRLVAVQTFDIGRLTTHPVPIVPSSFVAVSGEGPKHDSNGSGKTTFLSAVSLLLGDPQWRLERDGQYASKLLFSPEAAGFGRWRSGFDHGYIVGVFLSDGGNDPFTVWVRINNRPPYVRMRWVSDLHVAHSDTEQARMEEADNLWDQLPKQNERGARNLSAELYGEAPRCLAYLDTPMRPPVPSLLSQQMTSMSPADIGQALIALTGREHLLTEEVEDRRRFAVASNQLQQRLDEDRRSRIIEEEQLSMVQQRHEARTRLKDGERHWELHLAAGFLEKRSDDERVAERLTKIAEDLHDAERERERARETLQILKRHKDLKERLVEAQNVRYRIDQRKQTSTQEQGRLEGVRNTLLDRRRELIDAAQGDIGIPVEECRSRLRQADERLTSAATDRKRAEEDLTAATEHLDRVTEGRDGTVGEALAALTHSGIRVWGLLDCLSLTEQARRVWEPRLWRFRNAVAVAPQDADRALGSLSQHPGISMVLTDPLDSPGDSPVEGVSSPVPLTGFLHAVQERYSHESSPDRSEDAELGEWVLGGFTDPVTGREARLASARRAHEQACTALEEATRAHTKAVEAKEHTEKLLKAAVAAAELARCKAELVAAEEKVAEAAERTASLEEEWTRADTAYTRAKSALDNHTKDVALAEQALKQHEGQAKGLAKRHQEVTKERENLGLESWEQAWQRSVESASHLVYSPEATAEVARSSDAWRDRAMGAVNGALARIAPQAATAPVELTTLLNNDHRLSERLHPGADREEFKIVTGPLRDFLDSQRDLDEVLEERIASNRAARELAIGESRQEAESLALALDKTRQMVEGSIDRAMTRIRERFNELDLKREGGFGATLEIEVRAPSEESPGWTVNVTPKWRRSPQGGYISYRQVANGAQIKVFAIQLALAALLADDETPGRVLILDELGNSLGDENRKDVLRALQQVALDKQVTILGTCQDSVIQDAAGHCGQILWFHHASSNDPHNRPTRSWGYDEHSRRVEHIAYWLRANRSGLGTVGVEDLVE